MKWNLYPLWVNQSYLFSWLSSAKRLEKYLDNETMLIWNLLTFCFGSGWGRYFQRLTSAENSICFLLRRPAFHFHVWNHNYHAGPRYTFREKCGERKQRWSFSVQKSVSCRWIRVQTEMYIEEHVIIFSFNWIFLRPNELILLGQAGFLSRLQENTHIL